MMIMTAPRTAYAGVASRVGEDVQIERAPPAAMQLRLQLVRHDLYP